MHARGKWEKGGGGIRCGMASEAVEEHAEVILVF
jgi:hypothetical protein